MKLRDIMQTALGAFAGDRAGNFAMLTALAAVPILGAAGLAVDYANTSRMKVELQQALDAAVLAVAQRGDNISEAEARQVASAYLTGNLANAYTDMQVLRDGTAVTLSARTSVPLAFGGLFGYDKWPVRAASTADMAFASYEIALVLDTTGSMQGGKLKAMKDAVIGLIDDLSARVDDRERLKFALVPFSSFVNVGSQFGPRYDRDKRRIAGAGAEWLDLDGNSPIPQVDLVSGVSRFDLFAHLGQKWGGCVETRISSGGNDHAVDDTPPVKNDPASLFVPAFAIDEPASSWWNYYSNDYLDYAHRYDDDPLDNSPDARALRLLKYGLVNQAKAIVGNRIKDLPGGNAKVGANGFATPPNGKPNIRGGRGPNSGCYAEPITPLSSDYEDLKRKVRSFTAQGNTNIMEGVAWGMRVLSPHAPFTEGKNPADEPGLEKIMIVLSDGANVFGHASNALGSTYSSFGYLVDGRLGVTGGNDRKTNQLMNEKTLQACNNAKEKWGYQIYTIRLEERDGATGEMLRDCATSPAHYFDTPSRSQLDGVFKDIRDGITKLRLSS